MILNILFVTIDPALGRVDFQSLSDQTSMELLIEDLTQLSKEMFQEKGGLYRDVCEWPGVDCDKNERVTRVQFSRVMEGTLNLLHVPEHVKEFVFIDMYVFRKIHGTLEASGLREGLLNLYVTGHSFTGTIDFPKLPASLQELVIHDNRFSGSCDLTSLPRKMSELDLGDNCFTGSVELDKLPGSLEALRLQGNGFSGTLCFDNLPSRLWSINLFENKFSGKFQLTRIPEAFEFISARSNEFSGTAVVAKHYAGDLQLYCNDIHCVVDEDGEQHARSADFLCDM